MVGGNLRRFRADRALTLEKLAALSGVSRAMLSQIELEQSTPTMYMKNSPVRAAESRSAHRSPVGHVWA